MPVTNPFCFPTATYLGLFFQSNAIFTAFSVFSAEHPLIADTFLNAVDMKLCIHQQKTSTKGDHA